jgi:serine/threonine-protein kinase
VNPSPSSSGSLAPLSDGDLPARIGGYRVVRRLATGGTSDVLLARAEGPHGFERVVVLKLLLQQYRDDPSFERMFAREAAAYARLSHPAIVKLFDFFSDAGQLVMVLEYVDGLPLHKLRALLKSRSVTLDDAASSFVGWRIFGALAAAHAAKDPESGEFSPVIHRDVNPSNVLIPWDGHVKIADFGIAKVAGVDNDKTQAGFIKGTYGYMAPEQARGAELTVRADVYAASLLLWELLVGRKAIVRGSMSDLDVLRAMAEPAFPTLSALRPDLPPAVLDAIGRGLQPDPDRRAVTAEELAGVLRASTDIDAGRQRLVDALAAVRPPSVADDMVTTLSRPPAPRPADSSADATIPNPITLRGPSPDDTHSDALKLTSVPPRPVVTSLPPRPVHTLRMNPPGASSPPPPKTQQISSVPGTLTPPPRGPAPTPAPAPTLAPLLTARPPSVRPPPPATPLPPPPPIPPPPVLAPRGTSTAPIPVRTASVPPPPPHTFSPAPPPPPPLHPPVQAVPWQAPVPTVLLMSPLPPNAMPPVLAPTPQAPVVWTPPGMPPAPVRRRRPFAVFAGAAVLGLALFAGVVFVVSTRGRNAAYSPPSRVTPSAPAASPPTPAPTPAPAPAPAPAPTSAVAPLSPSPSSTTGTVTVSSARAGHRIYVDKHVVGESPGTFTVRCGWHVIKVGSQGTAHNLEVPCGGDVEAR